MTAILKYPLKIDSLRRAYLTKFFFWDMEIFMGEKCQNISKRKSSHQRCSIKKGVLRNFIKFTGKHLCQRSFFNKVAGLACNFIKKESLTQVFSCEFCEISKNTFLQNTSGRLLLLFPHKTAYSSNNSHNAYKNVDDNSKFT